MTERGYEMSFHLSNLGIAVLRRHSDANIYLAWCPRGKCFNGCLRQKTGTLMSRAFPCWRARLCGTKPIGESGDASWRADTGLRACRIAKPRSGRIPIGKIRRIFGSRHTRLPPSPKMA